MQKAVLFAFRDDPMCYIHVLLTALDMREKGLEAGIVLEGAATRLVEALAQAGHPLHQLYAKAKGQGLFFGACRACSAKLGALAAVEAEGLTLLDDMSGHPGMAGYMARGFSIITF